MAEDGGLPTPLCSVEPIGHRGHRTIAKAECLGCNLISNQVNLDIRFFSVLNIYHFFLKFISSEIETETVKDKDRHPQWDLPTAPTPVSGLDHGHTLAPRVLREGPGCDLRTFPM